MLKKDTWAVLISCAVLALVFVVTSTVDRAAYRDSQRTLETKVVQARLEDCNEAEALRRRGRTKAEEERKKLPETAALLRIPVTEKLVEAANKRERDALAELTPKDCYAIAHRG